MALAVPFALLTGCVSPTPYQPEQSNGGYSDLALNQDMAKVTFRGNALTSAQVVNNYLLRRSAELTLQKGYRYFVKLDGRTNDDQSTVTLPTTVDTYKDKKYSTETTTINPGSTYVEHNYTAFANIKMLKSNAGYPEAFDARVVLGNFAN